jgi:hypothetical protein
MSATDFKTIMEYRISPMDSLRITISETSDTYTFGNAEADSSFSMDDVTETDSDGCLRVLGTKMNITFYPLQNNLVEMETALAQCKSSTRVQADLFLIADDGQVAGRDIKITIEKAGVARKIESANGSVRVGINVTGVIGPNPGMPAQYLAYTNN